MSMDYPFDYMEHGYVSSCCGAGIIYSDICMDCKEHCDAINEEEDDEYSDKGLSRGDFIDKEYT